jgi:hypothetical protein
MPKITEKFLPTSEWLSTLDADEGMKSRAMLRRSAAKPGQGTCKWEIKKNEKKSSSVCSFKATNMVRRMGQPGFPSLSVLHIFPLRLIAYPYHILTL